MYQRNQVHRGKENLDDLLRNPRLFADPYSVFHQLRSKAPVYWSSAWNSWIITRHDDVTAVLRNWEDFSSAGRHAVLFEHLTKTERDILQPLERHYSSGGLINSDPPDHTRLRSLVLKAFTPRVVEEIRSSIQQTVNELLEAFQDASEVDIIQDLAYPLPAIVIAEVLGVPREDRDRFKEWTDDISAFIGHARGEFVHGLRAQRGLIAMQNYLRHLLDQRRKHPQEDLLTKLAVAEVEGSVLSEDELLATCVILLVAGHETTTNLIGNGLLALLKHPEQLHKLRENPSLITQAIEEILRYDGPLLKSRRVAKRDIELNGQQIHQGDQVMAVMAAANRDPAQFSHPDRLDITRHLNRHLAFGYGIHFCVGAPIARVESQIALLEIIERFPRLRLATDTLRWKDEMIRGLLALPVFVS